jgi:urease accessory protein
MLRLTTVIDEWGFNESNVNRLPIDLNKSETAMTGFRIAPRVPTAGWLGVALVALATPAMAHHPIGGAAPQTFMHGLLSGLGHPVIGLDHLAFIIAVGIAATLINARWSAPAVFIGGTIAGCLLAINGVALAQAEWLVAASVLLVGAMALTGLSFSATVYLTFFAVAGVLHGSAYAEAVIGSETTPIVAYLLGFAAIQFAIAAGMGWITRETWKATSSAAIQPRLAGAVIAGVGGALLFARVETVLFPGM